MPDILTARVPAATKPTAHPEIDAIIAAGRAAAARRNAHLAETALIARSQGAATHAAEARRQGAA